MSKEQTPITAEELIQELHDDLYNSGLSQKEYEPLRNKILDIRSKVKTEQKAKVLEALEKVDDAVNTLEYISKTLPKGANKTMLDSVIKEFKQK